jgi:hypothetical protein
VLFLLGLANARPASALLGESISGQVKDSGGAPIAGAKVSAQTYLGVPVTPTVADPFGVYTLSVPGPGYYRVNAGKFGFATEFYSNTFDINFAQVISVGPGVNVLNINFFLDPGGAITGTVKDIGSGLPITMAHVIANPAGGGQWGVASIPVDPTGVYTIPGVPVGSFKIHAEAPGYEMSYFDNKADYGFANPVTVTVSNTVGSVNFLLHEQPKGAIAGLVVLPDGSRVPGAFVDASLVNAPLHRGVNTEPGGNFTVTGLITGVWRLIAQPPAVPSYTAFSESREILVTLTTESLLTLTSPITLTPVNVAGRAVLPDGSGAGGSSINIHTTNFSFQMGAGTNPDGYFRAGGLPPGSYVLELHPPFDKPGLQPPPPVPFTLTNPGDFVNLGNITFTLPVKHLYVTVKYDGGAGVANVGVNANLHGRPGWANGLTNVNGQAGLNVGPGEWDVMISPSPNGTANWIYSGQPQLVSFASDNTAEVRLVTFTVETADTYVTGRVLAPNCVDPVSPQGLSVDVREPDGTGNHVPVSAGGYFSVPVVAGQYNAFISVDQMQYPNLSGPQLPPFSVASGVPYNLGNICLIEKTSGISGRIMRGDGSGIPGMRVHAWKNEGGWADTQTNNDGNYFISVISGSWSVNVELPFSSTFVSNHPPYQFNLSDNQVITGADFTLLETAGTIHGTLVDSDGHLLSTVNGWAYARPDVPNSPPVVSGPAEEGEFDLNAPAGTFSVGVNLPPNSGYSLVNAEQIVVISTGSAALVTFTLAVNDATLTGGFFTDDAKTIPAVGLEGEVFATGSNGAWQSTPINSADGRYTLTVAADTWNLGYHLRTADYVNNPPPNTRVTIASLQVFTFNFSVVAADATIEGHTLKPDDSPLDFAFASAHRNRSATSAPIDTGSQSLPPGGYFRLRVPAGGQYMVGANAPAELGFIQPDLQIVTPTTGATSTVTLKFRNSDGAITGTVYYHGEAGNAVYGPGAWVWAFSEDGQHTGAPANSNGEFQLNVVTGTTWHLGASYQPEGGSLFYTTFTPTTIVMDSAQATADLDIYLAHTALPAAIVATFDPSVGWTGVLSDGTRVEIPAGAMPTTDTVRIAVTPLIEELPNTLSARPFGYGYAIVAYEDTTGNQIVSSFNANVLITFYYTEEDLAQRGVTEDNLTPSYFSTTTNSWTMVDSFTVDTDANRITAQIDHFSNWGLTAPAEAPSTPILYLPLILRQ